MDSRTLRTLNARRARGTDDELGSSCRIRGDGNCCARGRMEFDHAVAVLQSLILITAANGSTGPVRATARYALRPSDPTGDCTARRSSSTRSFQNLAWPNRSYRSRGLRCSYHRSSLAGGCAHRYFSNGRRLPLLLRQTEIGARGEQHVAWSRSGSRIAVSRSRL